MPSLLLAAGAIVAVLAVWWFIDEYRDADDVEEAAVGAGRRASAATQAAARGSRVAVVGFAGLGASLAMEMLHFASDLNAVLGGVPVLLGHLAFGALALAGAADVVPLTPQQLGFAFVFVTVVALLLRYGSMGGELADD